MNPVLEMGIRLFLAGLFALAGFHKLKDFPGFCRVMSDYFSGVLGAGWIPLRALAVLVVLCELAVVVAVVAGISSIVVGSLAMALLTLYALAMGINLLRGNSISDCGCAWGQERPVQVWLPVRNLFIVCYSALLLMPVQAEGLNLFQLSNSAIFALATYLIYLIVDQQLKNLELEGE
jgi:uncharacterized membrane protein YphA (DoxX/SURF4 family)